MKEGAKKSPNANNMLILVMITNHFSYNSMCQCLFLCRNLEKDLKFLSWHKIE
jgi:hypothetical protein